MTVPQPSPLPAGPKCYRLRNNASTHRLVTIHVSHFSKCLDIGVPTSNPHLPAYIGAAQRCTGIEQSNPFPFPTFDVFDGRTSTQAGIDEEVKGNVFCRAES